MTVAAPPPIIRPRPSRCTAAPPHVSRFLVRGFQRYLTRGFGLRGGFVPRHFHAVRLATGSRRFVPADRPLVFFLNHPSWWDPLVAFLLARSVTPDRHPYAPIERAALDRYPLLSHGGLFGVDRTPRGAKTFLETARAVLARPDASLWLTPEGRFSEPAARPVRFEPGLGHLAARVDALFVPVAIEYRFWSERLPEILARIGDPIAARPNEDDAAGWTHRFERSLETTLDRLADDAESRDPARFETILAGRTGVAPLYDLGRRLRAFATGRRYTAEHTGPEGHS